MKACADFQEIIWMDLYGELKPELCSRLKRHLESCPACRRERSRMGRLMDSARGAVPAGDLAPAAAETLTRSITEALRREREPRSWRRWSPIGRKNSFPGLAATGLVLLLVVWFGVRIDSGDRPGPSAVRLSATEQALLREDYEVIRNLDLLEEMDTVEKLVQVVDKREYGFRDHPAWQGRSPMHRSEGIGV